MNELRDLFISFLVISLGFSILYSNRDFSAIGSLLPISMVGVGIGFIFHEIAHKITSMHFGYWAEYKLWPTGLIIAILTSFMGIIFAAPGAVYTYGNHINDRENGIISLAGPVMNIIISLIFLGVAVALYPSLNPNDPVTYVLFLTLTLGFSINSYLALFNLIPFGGLDGSKVFRWNKIIWIGSIIIAGYMTYLGIFVGLENIILGMLG
jgi:Zn-dependent protease